MSLDSDVQIKKQIMRELEEWLHFWGVVSRNGQLEYVTYEERNDLVLSIFDALDEGRALDPAIPPTVDTEDEHYNLNIIKE